jgi:hypothetical protein
MTDHPRKKDRKTDMIWSLGWKRPIANLERMRDLIPLAIKSASGGTNQ